MVRMAAELGYHFLSQPSLCSGDMKEEQVQGLRGRKAGSRGSGDGGGRPGRLRVGAEGPWRKKGD